MISPHSCLTLTDATGEDVYSANIDKMEQVRTITKNTEANLNLARMVVIGDQSAGKSSVISEISGIEFPNASGICTKRPIVVHTKRNLERADTQFTIDNEVVEREELTTRIMTIQRDSLGEHQVDPNPIEVKAEGPDCKNLVLVDLPGIIHSGEGRSEVREMIRKYIAPKETLIIVVTEAKQDTEGAEANEFIKEFDPDEERTLRVLTKFDNFDSEQSKERAVEMVSRVDTLSPHAVICRPKGEAYDQIKEDTELAQFGLPQERSGVTTLQERLPRLLDDRIRTNLPRLRENILQELNRSIIELERLGSSPPDSTQILHGIQQKLQTKGSGAKLEKALSPLLKTFQQELHDTRTQITAELIDEHYVYNVFEPPFYQGRDVFDTVVKIMVTQWWRPIIDQLEKDLQAELSKLFLIEDAQWLPNVSARLRNVLSDDWASVQSTIHRNLHESLSKRLQKETQFKTMNHYLTAKFNEELMLPDEVTDRILERINLGVLGLQTKYGRISVGEPNVISVCEPDNYDLCTVRESIRTIIAEEIEENQEAFNRGTLDEQHKGRLLASTQAYWRVAHKTMIDEVQGCVRDDCVIPVCEWVKTLSGHQDVRQYAFEDKQTAKQRETCKKRIESLKKCQDILQGC